MPQPDVALVDVSKEFRGRQQDVLAVHDLSLAVAPGEFFALLGPSGCGKTTTLRMIAGFEQPTRGEVLIRGVAMQGIPPFHRPVNTVFQDYALFPHMTVRQNVAFGLRMAGLSREAADQRAAQALELVQLPDVSARRPRQLSGGQQQRVALARALVNEPAVLLLDEPLGALDLKLRKQMQLELKAMQQRLGISFVYVTHDQEEAMTMADRIGVMHEGRLLQIGTPAEIYDEPVDRFVADFIGETNFLEGRLETLSAGHGLVRAHGSDLRLMGVMPKERVSPGADVTLTIRPEKLTLLPKEARSGEEPGDAGAEQHLLPVTVVATSYIGTDTRYEVALGGGLQVTVRLQNYGARYDTTYAVGEPAQLRWDAANARVLLR
ncbi:MAG: ABC transporter ATP-binding protein [Anaerolineaceae bacterium]|nr:ABC transporter ATP-binding protein [Anaerolineaceae bacterium]